ncbi:glutathione transferase [Plectosphaerella plurivora]|uniref:Glutathione transferase n=1 Tax=Plectosphaerella plurivora TaxID=936078 RepID=A0A9P8VFS4_9PEZI|nr:glutathione transferase [Plectosphaerella plurivora]
MSPTAKRARTAKDVPYDLIYWPGIPGRGEPIRLVLEEAGASYTDTATTNDVNTVLSQISKKNTGDASNPPHFAPPILKHGDLTISQLPNILQYLGQRHGLAPRLDGEDGGDGAYIVNQLALTVFDGLSNETHDTHHPVSMDLTYEDQQPESLRRADDYRKNRLPKYLGYFERVLAGEASGEGPWLHGGQLTYADIVLFQCLDGVKHAFPKALKTLEDSGDYSGVFKLYEAVRERPKIKAYLESDRRQKYSLGIYRCYAELDEQ